MSASDGSRPLAARRLPRSAEELERVWRAAPCAAIWFLMLDGLWPTLEEEIQSREAEETRVRS